MPELAEVEFYRKQWDPGLNQIITAVSLHTDKRVFRGVNADEMSSALPGSRLIESQASGKQMLFQFSKQNWLGIHLGMTGKLWIAPPDFEPGKHDHLVLFQKKRALVFSDMRQFGRVRFDRDANPPSWWTDIGAAITSSEFTERHMTDFLRAHSRLPIKGALLLQTGFPGVGNWMADEILWRARINPLAPAGQLGEAELKAAWRETRFVCRQAIRHVGPAHADPPANWFFHQRWSKEGSCPRDGQRLMRETVAGRTTAWCPVCQPLKPRKPSIKGK